VVLKESDVVGTYFWDCPWWQISEQTRQELISQFKKAVAGEQVVYEVEIAIAGNRTSTIIFSLRPIFDEQGKVLYVIPEGRPVDDVVEARDRFKSVLEGTNVGTWEWNIQTGEAIFNERWAEIIGYTLDELSPISIETWIKFGHPEDVEKSGELLRQHFEGEKDYYECEARMKHKNGQWVWVLDRGKVSKWTADGKPLLMSGTHQDVTERKQYQSELLLAKSAAEKANLAKSVFLV
jgi:PAS domain S-box-containing protein